MLSGRYRIVALLGRGGMGEVYRADDLVLGQQVALKFLPAPVARSPSAVERFRNEVRLARRVSHPNVCRVYDLGEAGGELFLSMEYVDGEDLGSLMRRIGRVHIDKALEIARKLCAGLAAVHQKGVLHRDLKPSNVMLDARGQVLLTDFGLAGIADQTEGAEVRNGTPAYMSPEQLSGMEVTVKSDLYSLGLIIYEILTGKRPFDSDTLEGLVRARRETTLPNPSTLVKDLDPRVERVIMRCLDPDSGKRPASALAVAAAFPGGDPLGEALAAGETPSPEMVAAAGEGTALAPRVAIALFALILIGFIAQAILARRLSALERMRLDYSPEVLRQKAREMISRFGYHGRPADEAYEIGSNSAFVAFVEARGNARWDEIANGYPGILVFRYRQSDYPLNAGEFHDDKLTPGVVTFGDADPDPPAILSGMTEISMSMQGRLTGFQAVPPQIDGSPPRPFDWDVLFEAAQLDPKEFQPAEPQWTFIGTSDQRAAWTGTWPGADWPLRVEAQNLHHPDRYRCGAADRGNVAGVAKRKSRPERPLRSFPPGPVHFLDANTAVAAARAPEWLDFRGAGDADGKRLAVAAAPAHECPDRPDRHFCKFCDCDRDVDILRVRVVDAVRGPRAVCAPALAASVDLLDRRAFAAVSHSYCRTRRSFRHRSGGRLDHS